MKSKIGIFGGTFDPVHNEHVRIAELFCKKLSLDMLYIIPNRIPPLKENRCASGSDRIKMLELAFADNKKAVISDMELKREGTSYTCDTIARLREMHPDSELYLLVGDDWIDSFDRWHRYEYILENATLVVASRSGRELTESAKRIRELTGHTPILLGNTHNNISSTDFRASGDGHLLPEKVLEYITERGLYR